MFITKFNLNLPKIVAFIKRLNKQTKVFKSKS